MVAEILRLYHQRKAAIEARLEEFRRLWEQGSDQDLFVELAYCLLTPQARGRNAWITVERLRTSGLLWTGSVADLEPEMRLVRFRRKARYLVAARGLFRDTQGRWHLREQLQRWVLDPPAARRWLVAQVPGMGFKEASHFLRNIGHGERLAILDRHILRHLVRYGVLAALPRSLTPRRYQEVEARMQTFAEGLGIPLAHLDLLLWSLSTGEVFK